MKRVGFARRLAEVRSELGAAEMVGRDARRIRGREMRRDLTIVEEFCSVGG